MTHEQNLSQILNMAAKAFSNEKVLSHELEIQKLTGAARLLGRMGESEALAFAETHLDSAAFIALVGKYCRPDRRKTSN